jgi:flagellar biosynthesis protein FlhF
MTPAQAQLEEPSPQVTGEPERRTYRGRELAELLPRIRAELGPDAVVTCQREGLVGGIRGFFAQRFVEVEAMAAPQPSAFDMYDGEDADPATAEFEPVTLRLDEPEEAPLAIGEGFSETLEGVVAVEPGNGFAAQLAAAAATPIVDENAYRPGGEEQDPAYDTPVTFVPPAPAPSRMQHAAVAQSPAPAMQYQAPMAPFAPTGAPVAPAASAAQPRGAQLQWPSAGPVAEPVLLHSDGLSESAIDSVWFAGESREAGEFLIARGIGARLAEDLIGEARTHDLPFAGAGGMRDALCACIARRLPRHRGLPRNGALIAVVGGGGSGKTRCAAAIAASYKGASALEVRAVVLGRYDSGVELSSLVEPLGVPVHTAERGSRAASDIAGARSGVLVVADTPAISPADPAGIGILGVELSALAPEEVLVALPATSNAAAARQLLAALAPLSPSGIIVTHADETDQLGTAVELSLESGLPVVYIHDGLELPGALAPADPAAIAERLLA